MKKAQTHVVGSPTFSIDGTPVFIDAEGRSDGDFYYLIGLRYEAPYLLCRIKLSVTILLFHKTR